MILRTYGLGLLLSLTIHGALIVVLLINSGEPPTVKRTVKPPKFIEAKLVELKPKTKKAAAKKQPKIIDLTARRRELEQQKKRDAERRRLEQEKKLAEQQKRKKAAAEKKKKEEDLKKKKKAEEAAKLEEKRRQQERAMLEEALMEEQNEMLELEYATDAQSYAGMIQKRIQLNWSRPPSARNGMRCELTIELLPNGRVLNADITKSSGNAAFDRSALAAINKIEVFPEVKTIPIEVFDRHFRKFILGFQPEDLRQ